ncbi:MAG: transcriptional repressor [Prevotella sp.]|jgi:Fur family ferric uptake transcriptional regulator|nr:transcriptional repressor [Prevotella sp.]
MNDEQFFIDKLEHRGIRPTATRLLVLREMMRGDEAVSLPELMQFLPTVDKSTISRALTLFLLHRLVHVIDDGSGALKYSVCADDCDCSIEYEHTHFYCESCGRTFCLRGIAAPVVDLPDGFVMHDVNYVIKGLCPECAYKK